MDKALVRIMLELTPHPAMAVDANGAILAVNGPGRALFEVRLVDKDVHAALDFSPFSWTETRNKLTLRDAYLECSLHNAVVEAPPEILVRALPLSEGAMVLLILDGGSAEGACLDFRQTEQRYHAIFQYAPVGVFTATNSGRFIEVNQTLATMLGYETSQEVVDTIANIGSDLVVHPESRQEIIDFIRSNPELASFENEFYRRDGSIFSAKLNVTVLQDPVHKGSYLLGMVDDITDRKKAEKAFRESQEKFSSIFTNAPVGIYQSTLEGRYLSVNPQFAAMYGFTSPAEVLQEVQDIGRQLYVAPSRRDEMVTTLLEKGSLANYEVLSRRKDGSEFWTSRNVRLLRDANGQPHHIEGFVSDISEQKELEHLREDVERITRHDLKSPLTSCILGVRMLWKDSNLTDLQREVLAEMEKSGVRMLNMINLSLDLYKMETGTYSFDPKEVDLLSVIRKAAKEAVLSERHKDLSLVFSIAGKEVDDVSSFTISCEELLCYSMFANLFMNAAQASPPGETISVDISPLDTVACISIHNMGAIPEAVRPHFFTKYATSGKRYGTGLGTYSARLIATTHGGDIDYATSEEQGTTLKVYLPFFHRPKK